MNLHQPPLPCAGALAASLAFAGLLLLPGTARAHRHDFPFTYDWQQAAFNEKEVEAHTTYDKADTSFEEEVEFEYGVSDRFSIAPYVVFERAYGQSLRYSGYQVEGRYKLTPYRTSRILSGLYAEYAKPKDEPAQLESRIVLSRYGKHGDDLSFNYVVVNDFHAHPHYDKTYSVGYAVPVGRSAANCRAGAEWIHNLTNNQMNLGPVAGFEVSRSVSFVLGYAFRLNKNSGNGDQARFIAEYEW